MDIVDTVTKVYQSGRGSLALDQLYSWVDDLLLSGEYTRVDAIFLAPETEDMPLALVLGLLTITLQWKTELKERAGFCSRVTEKLKRQNPTGYQTLLAGLL